MVEDTSNNNEQECGLSIFDDLQAKCIEIIRKKEDETWGYSFYIKEVETQVDTKALQQIVEAAFEDALIMLRKALLIRELKEEVDWKEETINHAINMTRKGVQRYFPESNEEE